MKVTVQYYMQARSAAGTGSESVELNAPCTVAQLLAHIGETRGDPLRSMLLTPDGCPHPAVLLFIADQQVRSDSPLKDGDVLTMLSPIAGG